MTATPKRLESFTVNNSGRSVSQSAHNLVAGSPAIDSGVDSFNLGAFVDQRGVVRPVGGVSDIGAVEVGGMVPSIPQPPEPPTLPPSLPPSTSPSTSPNTPPTSGGNSSQTPDSLEQLPDSVSSDLYSAPSAQRSVDRGSGGGGGGSWSVELGESSRQPKYIASDGRRGLIIIDNDAAIELDDGTIRTSFNLYNLTRSMAAVLVYDNSGKLVEARPVASRNLINEDDIWQESFPLLAPQLQFLNELREGLFGEFGFFDPRNTSSSQVTPIQNIDIPPGGTMVISHRGREARKFNDIESLINIAEFTLAEGLERVVGSGLVSTFIAGPVIQSVNQTLWEAASESIINGQSLSQSDLIEVGQQAMRQETAKLAAVAATRLIDEIFLPTRLLGWANDFAETVGFLEDGVASVNEYSRLTSSSNYQPYTLYNSPTAD